MSSINFFQGQTDLLKDLKLNNSENSNEEGQEDNSEIEEIKKRIGEFFNVKNIHFLLGSGTSCNAIPTMKMLYCEVVKSLIDKKNKSSDNEFYNNVYLEFRAIHKRVKQRGTLNLEEVLGILYSNRIYLEEYTKRKDDFKICEELIRLIENTIFNKINISFDTDEAKKVLLNYQAFYQKLALRNKDLSRLNIFTTNNDLFNEMALDSLNIHYINGFGGGINKFFNPALFNYTYSKRMDISIEKYEPVENMVNLYKIHGSVNWTEDDSNANTFFKIREINYPEKSDEAPKRILIYPTPTKQNKSLGSPYVELFREFQKKLLLPHSVLFIIGYSFSDEHVNNIIYQALATNSTITVVILNDIQDKDIAEIADNRIFKIWGEDNKGEKIHYFEYIVNNLFPTIDAYKEQDIVLKEFVKYYNKNLSK